MDNKTVSRNRLYKVNTLPWDRQTDGHAGRRTGSSANQPVYADVTAERSPENGTA